MARLTLVGEQILAAYPDSGVGRVTLVGEQVLADAPPNVTRVSNSALEVLVQGSPSPRTRVTLSGGQILAAVAFSPMRVSNSAVELLVTGSPPTRGRLTLAGEQILAAVAFSPMRVSNSSIELLIAGIPESLSPGRLFSARATATVEVEYPAADSAQSDATADQLWQQTASPVIYDEQGSDGRLHAAYRVATVPSSILTAEPAGRLYATRATATVDADFPLPSAPLSDAYVDAAVELLGVASAYPDAGLSASDATVSLAAQQAAYRAIYVEQASDIEISQIGQQVAALADYAKTGSDLTAEHLDQRIAIAGEYLDKDSLQSDLTADRLWLDLAAAAGYPDKDAPQGELFVGQLDQRAAVPAAYPDADSIVPEKRLHQTARAAVVPAGWLELQKTMLRVHFAARQATVVSTYPDPVDVRPAIEVGYLAPSIGHRSMTALGGESSIEASQVMALVATPAIYAGADAPQSIVTVDDLALLVVTADNDFGDLSSGLADSLPIVSIQLFYEE